MLTQFQQFKSNFPDLTTSLNFFTEDSETITFIDVETNRIEFLKVVTLSCGCCGDYELREDDLDYFINFMSSSDFDDLIQELKELIKTK